MLIFFILLVLGFVFYLKIASSGQIGKVNKVQELESIRISQVISFFPELQCSNKNIVDENCFDEYKIESFEALTQTSKTKTYFDFLSYSTIQVIQIYPPSTLHPEPWILYNNTLNSTSYRTIVPVNILYPLTKTKAFGIMTVQSYTQG